MQNIERLALAGKNVAQYVLCSTSADTCVRANRSGQFTEVGRPVHENAPADGNVRMENMRREAVKMGSEVGAITGASIDRRRAQLPRERLLHCGVESLRDGELLAVSLGTGYRGRHVLEVADDVLKQVSTEELVALDVAGWRRLKGVGLATAAQMVATFELARRGLGKGLGLRPSIVRPADALPHLQDIREQRREHFLCLYLNARNQMIHREIISIGSLSSSIVHPREVFQVAIGHSAASIVLSHNHPSGDVSPSREDIELTQRLVRAGQIMGIDILDHIIIAADDVLSMKEHGLL